jgi:hypothetical protein
VIDTFLHRSTTNIDIIFYLYLNIRWKNGG